MLALCAALTLAAPAASFSDFNGANLWPARIDLKWWRALGLGMARYDVSWPAVQPEPGKWNWREADAALLELANAGVPVLVLLGYTPPWAWVRGSYSFEEAGYRWDVEVRPQLPRPRAECIRLNPRTGERKRMAASNLPPANVRDWVEYVRRVVERYSKPPFRVRYFQVWNEFNWPPWYMQTWRDFIQRIHIPAAREIRRRGCKVVLGGWACTAGPEELCRLLRWRDCWRYVDVVDFHYQQNIAFQRVWDELVSRRRCWGIWETEIGWTPWSGYLANTYPRIFYWALNHGWAPGRYRVFWFHFSSAPALHGLVHASKGQSQLSAHGQALAHLAALLAGNVRPWRGFSCRPDFKFSLVGEEASAEGFAGPCSRVVVLHIPEAMLHSRPAIQVRLRSIAPEAVEVSCTDERGGPVKAEWRADGRDVVVSIPLEGLEADVWRFSAKGCTIYVRALIAAR